MKNVAKIHCTTFNADLEGLITRFSFDKPQTKLAGPSDPLYQTLEETLDDLDFKLTPTP
jgi:hypothetical protein